MLLSQLPSVLEAAGIGKQEMDKLDGLYKTAATVSGGVQQEFVERELSLLASILDQRAIEHHLEPSYFRSLTAIEAKASKEKKERERRRLGRVEKGVLDLLLFGVKSVTNVPIIVVAHCKERLYI